MYIHLTTKSKMNVQKKSYYSGEVWLRREGHLEWRWFYPRDWTKSSPERRGTPAFTCLLPDYGNKVASRLRLLPPSLPQHGNNVAPQTRPFCQM